VSAVLNKRNKEIRETFENENLWNRELRRRHPYQVNRKRMNEQDINRINRMNAAIKRDLDQNYLRADRIKSVGMRVVRPIVPVPEEYERIYVCLKCETKFVKKSILTDISKLLTFKTSNDF
jgi:hypothetical protein